MSSLDNMKKRLQLMGGGRQLARMNQDKLKSLKKALIYSYQAATYVGEDGREFRCLMNPNKLNNDYDIKMLSIPYEDVCLNAEDPSKVEQTQVAAGQTFTWKENGSHWIICLQKLEETAYFRAEVRRCRFSFEINNNKYWVYLRGPIETGMLWSRSNYTYFNKLNETAFMYVIKNEETEKFFSRFTKFKLGNQYWEVQATDKISVEGIIEVALKEDFTNSFDEPVKEITKEDIGVEPVILGPDVVKPYDTVVFSVKNINTLGNWIISKPSLASVKEIYDDGRAEISILTGKSGEFTLIYQTGEQEIEYLVKISSL